jgi:high-affinity iron transporter
MGQMLVATLREGIEAFLIVAIAATYLSRTGRRALLPAVAWGTGAALGTSLLLGVALAEWAVVPLNEGILALVAAGLVLSMVVFMLKAAKRMRSEIGERLEAAAARPGAAAWLGVFAFTLLMITREGMEMAFITAALSRQEGAGELLGGALAGIALAAVLAWAWLRFGHRVDLALFFQATSIFLVLFAVQLVFYAFHEFTEADAVPGIDNAYWHVATEDLAEGLFGQLVTAALLGVPLAWIGWQMLRRPKAA